MYRYDAFDRQLVADRVEEFRGQVARRLSGALSEEEFKPLRLMNGLYLQLHAYMLRVAIPYGTLSADQLRRLADIAERWDRGYGHFTTRQNIQFNWPKLQDVPDILEALAEVEMHAIQTSGNCIRNVTADPFAGVAADEIADPRPTAELIRQWSSLHPEFSFLPRKFKIAVTGAEADRAATGAHDIGLKLSRGPAGEAGYRVLVGGGLGRTPMVAKTIRDFLPEADLLPYLEAVMRVYNLHGRRDNKYKARIKILVHEIGVAALRDEIEAEFAAMDGPAVAADQGEVARIAAHFAAPLYPPREALAPAFEIAKSSDPEFARWTETNLVAHREPGYAIAVVTLKRPGAAPGDASADEMRALADLAERYSHSEARVTMEQNLALPHVAKDDLPELYRALKAAGLAGANRGLASDIVACPGMDYCALATARSIPIAAALEARLAPHERAIGPLSIKISGCVNACGHHHLGHIGILGLEKGGVESYQITLGGEPLGGSAIGERAGPGVAADEVADAVQRLVDRYLAMREDEESFAAAVARLGLDPFKEAFNAGH